jgi:hypothetical protein
MYACEAQNRLKDSFAMTAHRWLFLEIADLSGTALKLRALRGDSPSFSLNCGDVLWQVEMLPKPPIDGGSIGPLRVAPTAEGV